MSSSTPTLERYSLQRLPAWKRDLWRQVSEDAARRGVSPISDFRDGNLKPYRKAYQTMFRWLERTEDCAKYSTLSPLWRHEDGEWQLVFIERDAWVFVDHDGADRASCRRVAGPGLSGGGGIVVNGEDPGNGVGDDWDVVDPDELPEEEE